jgi:DNA-directed RNA polymerase specialized sigma24 family protein
VCTLRVKSVFRCLPNKTAYGLGFRKAIKVVRDSHRQKRGGQWKQVNGDSDYDIIQQLASAEPIPEMATQLTEQFQVLVAQLESTELIELATLKMEGFTNAEIAAQWGKAERTIERKLALVRQIKVLAADEALPRRWGSLFNHSTL